MANHFRILALRTPMNSMKRQKDMTLKDELPKSVGAQYATGEGKGKPLQYFCPENPMNSMKRKIDITPEDEPPGQ